LLKKSEIESLANPGESNEQAAGIATEKKV
jgi:hypothetical protein